MSRILLHVGARNPVWIVPLALPIAIFASANLDRAILFAWFLPAAVVVAHGASAPIERLLPRRFRFPLFVMVSAAVVTIGELLLARFGALPEGIDLVMLRATTVSGAMTWPALSPLPHDLWQDRLTRGIGVSLGFVLGLAVLTTVRLIIAATGLQTGQSVAIPFLILAVGRIGIDVIRRRTGSGR